MWGTIVNFITVVIGGILGTLIKNGFDRQMVISFLKIISVATVIGALIMTFFCLRTSFMVLGIGVIIAGLWLLLAFMLKNGLPDNISAVIMQGIGLSVMMIGISSALKTNNMLLVIVSLVIGGIIGELVGIESKLDKVGNIAQSKFGNGKDNNFSHGFVNASLLFCVGAMAIVGSLDAGLKGDYVTLYAKSTLDGITSIVLASTLGIGVAFSAIAVLLYQGIITLSAGVLNAFISEMIINEMSAVGGVLILGIGLSMLGIKKISIGNLLPAIFIPPLYFAIINIFN